VTGARVDAAFMAAAGHLLIHVIRWIEVTEPLG
jgi:hypothetical protein